MTPDELQGQSRSAGVTSRRRFLKSTAAVSLASPMLAYAQKNKPAKGPITAYVGTYSAPRGGHGKGIYRYEMDPATGALTQREAFPTNANPAWLTFDPSKTHLYSGNEISTFEGSPSGSVSAYSIDRASGNLTLLNTVASQGAGPAHISVHPSGKYVFAANYGGGTVAAIAIESDGKLGAATDVKHTSGNVGPAAATSAPPGSFAISGHDHPHAHMVQPDPAGRFVFAADLGLDKIFVWKFDVETGKLTPNDPDSVSLPPGDGPRHFCFHPNSRWMYSVQEESSTVTAFDYDATNGRLTAKQTLSTLPKGFAGSNFPSEISLTPDGKFLYVANRLHDSIAGFAVGRDGTLTFLDAEPIRGDYPRGFTIDPSGNFLFSCNQRSDAITTFRIHRKTGKLTFTGQYTPIGSPAIIVFLS